MYKRKRLWGFKPRRYRKKSRRSGTHKRAVSKKYGSPRVSVFKSPSGFPDKVRCKVRYEESLTFTQALGTLATNVYRGNSCFDPDFTGTGGQPYYFDQLMSIYLFYRVYGCKIEVWATSNTGPVSTRLLLVPSPTNTAFSSEELASETPYSKSRLMKFGAQGVGSAYMKHYMSTAKLLGVPKKAIAIEDDYAGSNAANPVSQWYWHFANCTPSLETQSMICRVRLTYYVSFEERNRPALS